MAYLFFRCSVYNTHANRVVRHLKMTIATCHVTLFGCRMGETWVTSDADPIMGVILKNTNHTNSFATAPPWPSLRRLAIALCNDELLRTVVLARKAAGHPIAELCLDNRLRTN